MCEKQTAQLDDSVRSPLVATDNPVPKPPFWGVKRLEKIPMRAVLPYINRNTLYKFQWGYKPQGRNVEQYAAANRHDGADVCKAFSVRPDEPQQARHRRENVRRARLVLRRRLQALRRTT